MGKEAALRSGLFRVCKGLRRGGVSAIREGVTNLSHKVRMAQYGTKHSHAGGVLEVMLASPDVEVVGVYEPDPERRRTLEAAGKPPWSDVSWFDSPADFLDDPTVLAVASEGSNAESLDHTEAIVDAGKHVFYDKPAGEDYRRFERIVGKARSAGLQVQMGYMFRHHAGFSRIAEWVRSGLLGDVFSVRAHMSTHLDRPAQEAIARHPGGIFYDLSGHMIDQIVWILGRPTTVTSFLRQDATDVAGFSDNTLCVLEYDSAMAFVDIAAVETPPMARRFEVYGTVGSAIMEPFEPPGPIRLCLNEERGGFPAGVSMVEVEDRPRYVDNLASFVKALRGEKAPDRSLDHELLVQETILRSAGHISE